MTSNKITRIHKIYAVAVTVTTILAGICLMAACLGIYLSGDEPYSREAVAAAFSPIAIPVYLCLGMVLLGFLLDLLLPAEATRRSITRQHRLILSRLYATKDLTQATPLLQQQIQKEQNIRKICRIVAASALAIGILVFAVYIFSGDRFTLENINGCVIRATVVLLICTGIPFGVGIASSYRCQSSMDNEIALLKQLPKGECADPAPSKKGSSLLIPRLTFLTAGLALLIYGFCTGGTADVLVKAINICTECVGLG